MYLGGQCLDIGVKTDLRVCVEQKPAKRIFSIPHFLCQMLLFYMAERYMKKAILLYQNRIF